MLERYSEFTSYLMKALTSLPPFHGTVYRGLGWNNHNSVKEAWVPEYHIGLELECKGFTSTSVDFTQAHKFSMTDSAENFWEIRLRGTQARLIEDFSLEPQEREVLLLPGVKLKVIEIQQDRIVMEEILPLESD